MRHKTGNQAAASETDYLGQLTIDLPIGPEAGEEGGDFGGFWAGLTKRGAPNMLLEGPT